MFRRFAALMLTALIATNLHFIPTRRGIPAPSRAMAATQENAAATQAYAVSTGAPHAARTQVSSTADDYTTHSLSLQEEKLLNLINLDRAANGLPPLTHDPELSRIARIKSEDMRDNGYFAHESPTWGKARQMLEHFGYRFAGAGENIAHHATVEKSQAAFMTSDGHRRNILSAVWQSIHMMPVSTICRPPLNLGFWRKFATGKRRQDCGAPAMARST